MFSHCYKTLSTVRGWSHRNDFSNVFFSKRNVSQWFCEFFFFTREHTMLRGAIDFFHIIYDENRSFFGVLLDMQTQTKEDLSSHTNLSVFKTTIGYKTHTDTSWAHVFFQHRTPNEVGSKEEQTRPTTNYFWVGLCCSSTGSSVPNFRIISCAESLSHKQSLLIIRNCRLVLLQQMSLKKNV